MEAGGAGSVHPPAAPWSCGVLIQGRQAVSSDPLVGIWEPLGEFAASMWRFSLRCLLWTTFLSSFLHPLLKWAGMLALCLLVAPPSVRGSRLILSLLLCSSSLSSDSSSSLAQTRLALRPAPSYHCAPPPPRFSVLAEAISFSCINASCPSPLCHLTAPAALTRASR